jgi:predicted ATP-dependent endonuclease of OLD family
MHRLESARIQNYRSIADSGTVDVESDITSLIGENESGKTNFLYALRSLNLDEEYDEDDLCLYNREDRRNKEPSEIKIATAVFDCQKPFRLNSEEEDADKIKVSKYFDSHYTVSFVLGEQTKDADIGTEQLRTYYSIPVVYDSLDEMESNNQFENEASGRIDIDEYEDLKKELDKKKKNPLDGRAIVAILNDLVDQLNDMRNQANNNNAQQAATDARNEVREIKDEIDNKDITTDKLQDSNTLPKRVKDAIRALQELPRFILHEGIDELDDQVQINKFNRDENRTFGNLLDLADLDIEQISEDEREGRFRRTKPASAEVSGIINDSWSQETIELELDIDGDVLSVFLTDDQATEGAFTKPSERSKGFQYFLSFYINFTAESQGELEDTILLLDDPGVFLHPSGKKDLLGTLEQLSDTNQILYTTHSPFLINQDRLNRIRIVDRSPQTTGTAIESEFHQNDSDALAPVRTALGAGIADSLFGSHSNILVEGASDKIIIESLSNYFRRRNRADEALDPDEISVINVGGADKMPYFARLIDAEGYDYVILLDNDQRGRERKNKLESEHDIESDNVVLLDDVVPAVDGFDSEIEDLFEPEFFYDTVLEAYSDIFDEGQLEDVIDEIPEESIANRYEQIFGEELHSDFDKVMVAKHISTVVRRDDCSDDTVGEETIENFRELFSGLKERL